MEIVRAKPIQVAFTYGSDGTVYTTWTSGQDWRKGDRVYDDQAFQDYEALEGMENNIVRPSESKKWTPRGSSAYILSSYDTDADVSAYDTFEFNTAWGGFARFFDPSDGNDYLWNSASSVTDISVIADYFPSQEYSADWTKIGAANGLRLVNPRVLERTKFDTSLNCSLWATGEVNRIGLFGLINVKDVDVTVAPGEKIPNPSFTSPAIGDWQADGALSHSAGTITFDDDVAITLHHVPGKTYEFVANLTVSSSNSATIQVQSADGATVIATSSVLNGPTTADVTLSYTATGVAHRLVIIPGGAYSITANSVSCQQTGIASENHTADLSYSEAALSYKAQTKIVLNNAMDSPTIDVILETEYPKTQGEVGFVCAGMAHVIGETIAGVRRRLIDYSYTDFSDDFGTAELLQRGYQDEVEFDLLVPGSKGAFYDHYFRTIRAQPCMFDLATQDADGSRAVSDDGLLIFGIAMEPERNITALSDAERISVEIRGLVTETGEVQQ